MNSSGLPFVALSLLLPFTVLGQDQPFPGEMGFELGILQLKPEAYVLGAYDNRVVTSESSSEGDAYGEVGVALTIENTDALYDLGGLAEYGHRAYDEFSDLDGDFYEIGGNMASRNSVIKAGIDAYHKKTLDYDVRVKNGSGGNLGSVLTSETSERSSVRVDAGYEKQLTGRTAVMPAYEGWYYNQNFGENGSETAEWQEHSAAIRLGYGYSERTVLGLVGSYSIQLADEEDGSISRVAIEARSRATDKVDWNASLGYAVAEYDLSGTSGNAVASLRAQWQAREKVSAYVFGANSFQPGYRGSGARQIYRAGYGADWRPLERLRFSAQVLHDYQESIQDDVGGSSADLGVIRHFVTGQLAYYLTRNLNLAITGQYIDDELEQARSIVSCRAMLSF